MVRHTPFLLAIVLVAISSPTAPVSGQAGDCTVGVIETIAGRGADGCPGDGAPATQARLFELQDVAVAPDGTMYIADTGNHRVVKVDVGGAITTVAGTCGLGYSGDGVPGTEAGLHRPVAVAVAGDGSIYIADNQDYRVRKVDPAGIITTIAGSGAKVHRVDVDETSEASFPGPGIALGADGSLYIADATTDRIRKIDPAGIVTTVAGSGGDRYGGDGGPATQAWLNMPTRVAVGEDGSLYIADTGNQRIRKIDPAGIITTIAGSGPTGLGKGDYSGDGGPATKASLNEPEGVAVAPDGSLYIVDSGNHRVRKVSTEGVISTIAGDGWADEDGFGRYGGDGGPATEASLNWPRGVAVGADGSIYIADCDNHRLRKVDPAGTITTVAGSGRHDFSGDQGPATEARLGGPCGVAVGGDGSIVIADTFNDRIASVGPGGVIATVAGRRKLRIPRVHYSGDGGPATQATLQQPWGVAVAADGSILIADASNSRIRKIDTKGIITTIVGRGRSGNLGDGGEAIRARLSRPSDIAVGPDGSIYIADTGSHRIRKVDPAGMITTIAGRGGVNGGYRGDGGPATQAQLNRPRGVAVAGDGSIFIADTGNDRVRKIDPAGIITTVAGTGVRPSGYGGDGGPATQGRLNGPCGVAVAGDGSLYIADAGNNRIRKVDPAGIITTIAGDGQRGYSGDGGDATHASLYGPSGIALGPDGSLYIADSGNNRIRKVRWFPCEREAAKTAADGLRARAGDATGAWGSG